MFVCSTVSQSLRSKSTELCSGFPARRVIDCERTASGHQISAHETQHQAHIASSAVHAVLHALATGRWWTFFFFFYLTKVFGVLRDAVAAVSSLWSVFASFVVDDCAPP